MGECLITRRGGEVHKLPVLNESYPADAEVQYTSLNTASATFNVVIAVPGSPAEYTYQWYLDGAAVDGATNATFTVNDLSETATHKVYCTVKNKAGTVASRIATLSVTQWIEHLYNEGVVNTDLTSGIYGTNQDGALYFRAEPMAVANNETFTTYDKIDLSNVSKVCVRFMSYTSVEDVYLRIVVCESAHDGNNVTTVNMVAGKSVDSPFDSTEQVHSLDVSNIDGEYYLGYAWGVYGSADGNRNIGGYIYEWWLE